MMVFSASRGEQRLRPDDKLGETVGDLFKAIPNSEATGGK